MLQLFKVKETYIFKLVTSYALFTKLFSYSRYTYTLVWSFIEWSTNFEIIAAFFDDGWKNANKLSTAEQ